MKTILVSASLVAGTVLGGLMTTAPAYSADPQICEGSAIYCEQFAFNCTMNNGLFTNLRPNSQRIVSYSCELPEGAVVDLTESNLAGMMMVTPIGGDNGNDNHSSSSDDGPSDSGPSDSGNDNSGNDSPSDDGGSGGDDGQGNIL